jgi:hypothetical protein
MAKLSPFEKLIASLEVPVVPEEKLERLLEYAKESHIYSAIFESYIGRRIHENIHPERLLNIAYHMEWSEKTHFMSLLVNRRLAACILYKNEGYDQLYFMYRHDLRSERHVFGEVVRTLSNASATEAIRIVDVITPRIGIDRHLFLLRVITVEDDYPSLRRLQMMDKLELEDQFLIWAKGIENNSTIINYFNNGVDSKMTQYMIEQLIKSGDDSPMAKALIISNISITKFESCHQLNNILVACSKQIPQTLEYLYRRAEMDGRYEYLLMLGANKNKKELLRSLVKSKDHDLIDRFFFLYKDCPEVKHLTPFL